MVIYSQETFEALARMYIKRDGLEELLAMLVKSDFYKAPASTKYHDAHEGGLVKHSIKVFYELQAEYDCGGYFNINEESIAIVALFHDLCKVGFYKVSSRNVKDDATGKWEKVPYYEVEDKFPYGHGEKSVFMINDCLKLTTEEALAIRWHMGFSEPKENYLAVQNTFRENPLAVLLHLADIKACYLPEERSE